MKFILVSVLVAGAFALALGNTSSLAEQPVELGNVNWNMELDEALELAKKQKRPLFVQFQEVPG